jgi:hypothetical protein
MIPEKNILFKELEPDRCRLRIPFLNKIKVIDLFDKDLFFLILLPHNGNEIRQKWFGKELVNLAHVVKRFCVVLVFEEGEFGG